MVVRVLERKPNSESETSGNFESKYLIKNGNYVKFGTSIDTLFRNIKDSKNQNSSPKNDGFYEIINKRTEKSLSNSKNSENAELLQEEDKLSMWIDSKDLYCSCPKIRLRRKYLVMSKHSNLLKYLDQPQRIDETSSEEENYDMDSTPNKWINTTRLHSRQIQVQAQSKNTTRFEIDTAKPSVSSASRFAGLLVDRETAIIEWRPNYVRRMRRFLRYFKNGKCT